MAKGGRRKPRRSPTAARPPRGAQPRSSRGRPRETAAAGDRVDRALRERQARDREGAKRRRVRRLVAVGIALALLAALVVVDVYIHRLTGPERELLAQAPAASTAASCTPVQVTKTYPNGLDRSHLGSAPEVRLLPPLSTYPSNPPASGPHDGVPLDAGVYTSPPPIGKAIHSLEHAAAIVWYDPSLAPPQDIQRIGDFFRQKNERNHVIVAPYQYPDQGSAGVLPSGRGMALVAWHHIQYCNHASLPVAFAFVHSYRFNLYQQGAYRGDAPEKYSPI
jgi:hypothetical protein